MAKPTAPRDNKPQTREEEENKDKKPFQLDSNVKMILIVVLSMLLGGIIFLCLNYVLIDNLLGSKLPQQTQTEDNGEDTSDEEEQVEKGIIVDLGDFVLNLADVDSKKYLNDITKYIVSNIEQIDNGNIMKTYSKLCKLINNELLKTELPVSISTDDNI